MPNLARSGGSFNLEVQSRRVYYGLQPFFFGLIDWNDMLVLGALIAATGLAMFLIGKFIRKRA